MKISGPTVYVAHRVNFFVVIFYLILKLILVSDFQRLSREENKKM